MKERLNGRNGGWIEGEMEVLVDGMMEGDRGQIGRMEGQMNGISDESS